MGKGTRTRISREAYLIEQESKKKAEALKKKKIRKASIIVTSCILVLTLIAAGSRYAVKYATDDGYFMRKTVAVKSDSYTVDNAMMSYFINSTYQSFIKNNSSNLTSYGLDTTKSLKDQSYSDSQTWYDYFIQISEDNVKQMLVLAEAAKAEGVSLSDDEQTTIQTQLGSLTPSDYGLGVKSSDIENCMEIYMLAYKYSNQISDGLTYSDNDLENYYNSNKNTFTTYNYRSYTFSYSSDDSTLTQAKAKTYADDLYACKGDLEFTACLTSYLKASGNYADDAALQTELDKTLTNAAKYTADNELSTWAFTDGRQVGETYLLDDTTNSCYTVYVMLTTPERDNSSTVDVRHILLTSKSYGSDDATLAAAQGLYDQWKAGDQTEDSFADLAISNSEDTGSASKGGLYEGVYEGQMVDTFNDWCFDASRQPGDTGIVATSYGQHIMYFVGSGGEKWTSDVTSALQKSDYDNIYTGYESTYTVTQNDENISKINIIQS